jgi:hypothetical protein
MKESKRLLEYFIDHNRNSWTDWYKDEMNPMNRRSIRDYIKLFHRRPIWSQTFSFRGVCGPTIPLKTTSVGTKIVDCFQYETFKMADHKNMLVVRLLNINKSVLRVITAWRFDKESLIVSSEDRLSKHTWGKPEVLNFPSKLTDLLLPEVNKDNPSSDVVSLVVFTNVAQS